MTSNASNQTRNRTQFFRSIRCPTVLSHSPTHRRLMPSTRQLMINSSAEVLISMVFVATASMNVMPSQVNAFNFPPTLIANWSVVPSMGTMKYVGRSSRNGGEKTKNCENKNTKPRVPDLWYPHGNVVVRTHVRAGYFHRLRIVSVKRARTYGGVVHATGPPIRTDRRQ